MIFFFKPTDSDIEDCDCLPSCNSIEYEFSVVSTSLNHENEFLEVNNVSFWTKRNYYAGLSISFSDTEFTALKRYANYETISFISNAGGLLGLFLGVSFMSFIEIFYFVFIRVWIELIKLFSRRHRKHKIERIDLRQTLTQIEF